MTVTCHLITVKTKRYVIDRVDERIINQQFLSTTMTTSTIARANETARHFFEFIVRFANFQNFLERLFYTHAKWME